MSIFNRTSLMESINSINVEPYEGYIEPTMESVAEINAELNENMYKLNTSLYIADLLLEQRAQAGEDVEALVEATIKDYTTTTLNKYKIILSKIKTFFINLIKRIQDLISGGKKFIDKYEKGILKAANNKDAKWIEYDERYDVEKIMSSLNGIEKTITVTEKKFNSLNVTVSGAAQMVIDDMRFIVLNNIEPGTETYDEAKKIIIKKIKGKKTGEKKKLDKADLIKMIDHVKKYTNGGKAETQKQAKKIIKLCEKTISGTSHLIQHGKSSGADKQERKKNNQDMNKILLTIQESVMFIFWLSSQLTTAYSNQYRYNLSVLKAFVSANPNIVKGTGSSQELKDDVPPEQPKLLENILEAF